MSYSVDAIQAAIVQVEDANGSKYVSAPLYAGTREALQGLAVTAGVTPHDAKLVSDADLIALYVVARKRPSAAKQIADKLSRKYGLNLDPIEPLPREDSVDARELDAAIAKAMAPYVGKVDSLAGDLAAIGPALSIEVALAVSEALKAQTPTMLTVTQVSESAPVELGLVHKDTARIIRNLAAGLNVYLHGPAGSGKTTVGLQAAKALGVPFHFAAKVESEYMLLGFKDARGETVRTQFREAYEHGGLFLFDELDGSSPSAVVALNAALANGFCPFPDGTIQRHENFYCLAAGNTKLTGASRAYNGRQQLDGASIDRFYFIEFDYDEQLEMAIAPNKGWCLHVQAVRAAVKARGLEQHLVTPRATIDGAKALAAGDTWEQVELATIFKGLDSDTINALRAATAFTVGNDMQLAASN